MRKCSCILKLIKTSVGFGLLDSMIGMALIMSVTGYGMVQFGNYRKSSKIRIEKTQVLVFKKYLTSKTSYIDDCINSIGLSNSDLATMISTGTGDLIFNGPAGSTIGNNAVLPDFGLTINTLRVNGIILAKQAHGFSFYSGEIFFDGKTLGRTNDTGGESLGIISFLVDNLGIVVACSSKEDLNNYPGYVSKRDRLH